jgi:hypothetical protein
MKKRFRAIKPKPGELLVKYGKEPGDNPDLLYCWPENTCGMRRDSRIVMNALERIPVFEGRTLREELEARGYDITTLRLSIKKQSAETNERNLYAEIKEGFDALVEDRNK